MKRYVAYIRVSTPKQGERGSSLQEQKAAIDAYARRHDLGIAEWFEEQETAAKRGRPIFNRMMKVLEKGQAVGVITHKIDRSARNLRDWAALGELVDRGVELHFAHESIDLSSRGGRLSADIQAVVAADYVRNLRDEVRKGFYGRLKQGFYPLPAPVGYLDQGRAVAKAIDPLRGPLVATAFRLYATGEWSLDTLRGEMHERGLRSRAGATITRSGLSTILNNPFYVGLIRMRKCGEVFQGLHAPLIGKDVFDRVQELLRGKCRHRTTYLRFRYQRMLSCASCGYRLVAERRKGHVYYRCHTVSCPETAVREEAVDEALCRSAAPFALTDEECAAALKDIDTILAHRKTDTAAEVRSLDLQLAAIDGRLDRLTDAYVDQVVDRDTYLRRKEQLLGDRTTIKNRIDAGEAGDTVIRQQAERILGLVKALGTLPISDDDGQLREILGNTTSDLTVQQKYVAVAWENPFLALANEGVVAAGGPYRATPRTGRTDAMVKIITQHCERQSQASNNEDASLSPVA